MNETVQALRAQLTGVLATGLSRVAILGVGGMAIEVAAQVRELAGPDALLGIFDPREAPALAGACPWEDLAGGMPDVLVIAADDDKERLLRAAAAVFGDPARLPVVILTGLAHQDLRDPIFEELERPALVPSYATGHPATRMHLYQVLAHAARHGSSGAVVELGAFKGGTTVWLARAVAALGLQQSPVLGFDSWDGFPPRRSLLDLYEHPRCVFRDLDAVRAYAEPYGIELVPGDITETVPARLAGEPVLLAFVDTDNYSGTRAALETIAANLLVGGAIVFDHYHTTGEYLYTIGERLAAQDVLGGAGLLQLHGTGVFVKTA